MRVRKTKILELNHLDRIDQVELAITEIMKELGFKHEIIYGTVVSVVEAVTNAIKHGNRQDPLKKAKVYWHKTKKSVSFTIHDEGDGFDPTAVPDPTKPENIEKTNGRGIFLMRSLMDKVKFDTTPSSGTRVVMFKHLPSSNRKEGNHEKICKD